MTSVLKEDMPTVGEMTKVINRKLQIVERYISTSAGAVISYRSTCWIQTVGSPRGGDECEIKSSMCVVPIPLPFLLHLLLSEVSTS